LGDSLVAEPTHLIGNLKVVKSPAETIYVRKAASIADAAMASCVGAVGEGRTEQEVAGEVYRTLLASGGDIPASPMNLCSGERSAFAHGAPGERRLERGDFIHAQFGAAYRRYCCTIGRQLSLGEPTARMRELYGIAREASDACMAEMRAGVSARRPHEAAKAVIARAGMDRYRLHMSGYAVGTAYPPSWVEPLLLFDDSPYTLEAGMVIAVEPPLFGLEEGLGVRIIDNVLVTESGVEVLSKYTSELIVV
jgi:Xaa-Pro dipeptidase